jgi:hypothetical protein
MKKQCCTRDLGSLVYEFIELRCKNDDKELKKFISNEENQKEVIYDIFYKLFKIQKDIGLLKNIKKTLDDNLSIDAFQNRDDLDVYKEIEEMFKLL